MLIDLKKEELLGVLDLAIVAADTFDKHPKTKDVRKFSFKNMSFITTTEKIHYEWYIWEVSLPRFLRGLRGDVLISNKEEYYVDVCSYTNLLNLIAGKDFDPFVIGKL